MPESAPFYDTIIIGAGAAGLMCAAQAGQRGKRVLVLDHAEKPGKKILISGGGRCNFTNRFTGPDNFISNNPHFCKSALARFSADDFLQKVKTHGIPWEERSHGQLFCIRSAGDILEMLLTECREAGVCIKTHSDIQCILKKKTFRVNTSQGNFSSAQLVIASGGLSIPKMGATPFGLKIAEQFGLNIIPPRAGLAPLTFTGTEKEALKSLAGISLPVSVRCNGQQFNEAMLFTHRGLSGPAILQISSYWQPGDCIHIDLLPDIDVVTGIERWQQTRPQAKLSTMLASLLPRRLAHWLCETQIFDKQLERLHKNEPADISKALHNWQLKPNASEGYRTAEVTLGGVDTDELSSSDMQARNVPGLYFIGEVVDVTGHLGGFNFQWAWSSGYACGTGL